MKCLLNYFAMNRQSEGREGAEEEGKKESEREGKEVEEDREREQPQWECE